MNMKQSLRPLLHVGTGLVMDYVALFLVVCCLVSA